MYGGSDLVDIWLGVLRGLLRLPPIAPDAFTPPDAAVDESPFTAFVLVAMLRRTQATMQSIDKTATITRIGSHTLIFPVLLPPDELLLGSRRRRPWALTDLSWKSVWRGLAETVSGISVSATKEKKACQCQGQKAPLLLLLPEHRWEDIARNVERKDDASTKFPNERIVMVVVVRKGRSIDHQ
jgi:hypothetical protein